MPNTNKYATLEQFKATYSKQFLIRISNFNDEDDFTDYQDDNLNNALQDSSDIMDGYLMERYSTPLSPAPDFFKPDCMVIAVMKLIERKGFSEGTPDEQMYLAGKDLIRDRYLKISEGKISISIPDASGDASAVSNIQATSPDRIFPSTTLDTFYK